MIAHWTDASRAVATATSSSVEELRALIDQVRALGEPTILFVELDGKTLALGLGAPLCPLTWVEPGGASFHCVGDLSRIGTLRFWCRDQPDEFFADLAVPEAVAIEAALAFARTAERPSNVRWEADW